MLFLPPWFASPPPLPLLLPFFPAGRAFLEPELLELLLLLLLLLPAVVP